VDPHPANLLIQGDSLCSWLQCHRAAKIACRPEGLAHPDVPLQ